MQTKKLILQALNKEQTRDIPFWMMRQAGRYLPEYRELRAQSDGFLDLCFSPDKACEVTLQPIRRFDMDAAILFSDILVIPYALGQDVRFEPGKGPILAAVSSLDDLKGFSTDKVHDRLGPVYETVSNVRAKLDQNKTLIGFAGSPWTVATYMVKGSGSRDFHTVKSAMASDVPFFEKLIDLIVEGTIAYLDRQVQAGADCIQLFDSWANVLDPISFRRWVIEPTAKIVSSLKTKHPNLKVIGFAKGANQYLKEYGQSCMLDGLGLDSSADRVQAGKNLQPAFCLQGNLDPVILRAGGAQMDEHIDAILQDLSGGPFIFNLGHGIIKDTPITNVERLVEKVKSFKRAEQRKSA